MNNVVRFAAAAVLTGSLLGTALAQSPPPAGTPQPSPPPPGSVTPNSGMAAPGGMMGGDMGRMMRERMAAAAMQPFRRIEGQLAYFRTELQLTEAQAPLWNAFADRVRDQSERLRQATQQAMAAAGPGPAPQQMERRIALLSAHLEATRTFALAAAPLYAALSEEQRRTADELMAEHLRSMRMP